MSCAKKIKMPLNCRKLPCHSGQNGTNPNLAWIYVISKYLGVDTLPKYCVAKHEKRAKMSRLATQMRRVQTTFPNSTTALLRRVAS